MNSRLSFKLGCQTQKRLLTFPANIYLYILVLNLKHSVILFSAPLNSVIQPLLFLQNSSVSLSLFLLFSSSFWRYDVIIPIIRPDNVLSLFAFQTLHILITFRIWTVHWTNWTYFFAIHFGQCTLFLIKIFSDEIPFQKWNS